MFIGGLQGAKWEIPHQEIQNATKACHGLFPKRLVMEAACLFAQRLQVEQIIAVSNETHIYRSLRYRDKEGKIHADYNAFWESVGGVCDAERHYRLPAQIARKEIAEIASKNGLNTVGAMRCSTLFSHKWPRCFVVSRPDRAPATARVRTFFQQRRYGVHTTTSGLHCHFNGKIGFGRAMDRFRDNFAQIHRYIFRDLRHAVEHIGKSWRYIKCSISSAGNAVKCSRSASRSLFNRLRTVAAYFFLLHRHRPVHAIQSPFAGQI